MSKLTMLRIDIPELCGILSAMMGRILPETPVQAVCALFVALMIMILAAPEAAAHPVPHQAEAFTAGAERTTTIASLEAASCCHVVSICSVTFCDDPVGALSWLSWSRAGLRLTKGTSNASLASGADPPPPRG